MPPREVWICTPTRDGFGVIHTAIAVSRLPGLLNVPGRVIWTEANNIPRGRDALVADLRQEVQRDAAWVLWVDSDILLLEEIDPVVEAIRWSWETGQGWTAHYAMADGRSHMMRGRGLNGKVASNYTAEEVEALPDWHPIEQCGLGFAFIPMDLTYEFHAATAGEDVHFFVDTDITLAFAKRVHLRHRKSLWI